MQPAIKSAMREGSVKAALHIEQTLKSYNINILGDLSTHYYHSDHLGSSTVITNESGTVVTRIAYNPFGKIVQSRSVGLNTVTHKFTSQELDEETDLMYYNARFYDPSIGRFLSADTMVPNPLDAQQFNRYAYVLNNPVMYTDPTGHQAEWDGGTNDYNGPSAEQKEKNKKEITLRLKREKNARKEFTRQKAKYMFLRFYTPTKINGIPIQDYEREFFQDLLDGYDGRYDVVDGKRHIHKFPDGYGGPMIHFKNDDADQGITVETAKMVEDAVVNSGVNIGISCTTGEHEWPSRHVMFKAVDIYMVDGIRIKDIGAFDVKAKRSLSKLVRAFREHSNIREIYSPIFNKHFYRSDIDVLDLWVNHSGDNAHLHVSGNE